MRQLIVILLRGYRLLISPWLGPNCRFYPSCSDYAIQAVTQHGAVAGAWLTLKRIGRCRPGCAYGLDPVPRPGYRAQRRPGTAANAPACSRCGQ